MLLGFTQLYKVIDKIKSIALSLFQHTTGFVKKLDKRTWFYAKVL